MTHPISARSYIHFVRSDTGWPAVKGCESLVVNTPEKVKRAVLILVRSTSRCARALVKCCDFQAAVLGLLPCKRGQHTSGCANNQTCAAYSLGPKPAIASTAGGDQGLRVEPSLPRGGLLSTPVVWFGAPQVTEVAHAKLHRLSGLS